MEENNRPIFIAGCERSGTTMLRLMLFSHPRIGIPPQTKFLKKLYKRRLYYGNLSNPATKARLLDWFDRNHNRNTQLIDLGLSPGSIRKAITESEPTFGSAIGAVYRLYAAGFGKVRWGDKKPYYIQYLPQLLSLFPDAQVIHVVRDGRDCVASLDSMPWWRKSSIYSMLNWRRAIRKGEAARKKLAPDRFMELRYEDLVANPEAVVKKVCAFLGEEYSPELLEFRRLAETGVPSYKMGWHYATKQEVNADSIDRWKKDLAPWKAELMQRMAERELRLHSYADTMERRRLPLGILFSYWKEAFKFGFDHGFAAFADRVISLVYPWQVEYVEKEAASDPLGNPALHARRSSRSKLEIEPGATK